MNKLPTEYQSFVHLSRYSRWIPEENRRETWDETVDRYVNYMCDKQCSGLIPKKIKEEIRAGIKNLEVMPSMRCMMTAGPALERDNVAGFNCFTGETLVTTREYGVVPIGELEGKEVHIVDGNGEWTLSKCRNYGKVEFTTTVLITTKNMDTDLSIEATSNHDWIMKNGIRKKTYELKPGDILASVPVPVNNIESVENKNSNYGFSKVKKITKNMNECNVYCFDVSTTHSFLLTRNILTGNCSYVAIDNPVAFDEILYLLMNGAGAGFSVEKEFVSKLPVVAEKFRKSNSIIKVEDSKIGWAEAFRELVSFLYSGVIPKWDVSKVRPAGARLKVFGGRASGPMPLEDLFRFTINIFTNAAGRKLHSIECHDICCKVAEIVVVGGVRRCLPEGALIQTKNGMVPIEKIKIGDQIVTGGLIAKVIKTVKSGKQQLLNIYHENGHVEVTRNHRVAVFINEDGKQIMDFKCAGDLLPGDILVWDSIGTNGKETFLPEIEDIEHTEKSSIITPSLDEDVAWFLGLVQGGGCVGEHSIEVTTYDFNKDVFKRAKVIANKFNINSRLLKGKPINYRRLLISSKSFISWCKKYLKNNYTPYDVPSFIMNSTKNIRWAYLAGVFDAIGECENENEIKQIITTYSDFGNSITSVLASLGVGSRIFNFKNRDMEPNGVTYLPFYSIDIVGEININKWIRNISGFSISDKLNKISNFDCLVEESTLLPSIVSSISLSRNAETYDMEVEDINRFTTSGIVVHNSALISLSDLQDNRMRHAKSGEWYNSTKHRMLANNSCCYTETPGMDTFMREWVSLYESKSGERGIFNRVAAEKQITKNGRREPGHKWGTNPCSEIILRSSQVCNLSEVVVRPDDDFDSLARKIRLATIMGTMQSSLTNFRYLRDIWKKNTAEEALLGVSLTGIMDNEFMSGRRGQKDKLIKTLEALKQVAIDTNEEWSTILGVNQSVAVTCVKPSGCTTLDTRVKTNLGIMSMREIFLRNNICIELEDAKDGSWFDVTSKIKVYDYKNEGKEISKLYFNGLRDVYEITTKDWLCVKFTGNHKLLTKDGWKRVDSLSMEDEIIKFEQGNEKLKLKIRSIIKSKEKQLTVDIEVKDTHSYQLSNGMVSHNTVSQLVDASSGIHPRHSRYYIRRVRADKKDPLAQFMKNEGFLCEDDCMKPEYNYVFSFPIEAPKGCILRDNINAIQHLELWKIYQDHWCEHKPSVTINVKEHEWMDVGAWTFRNIDSISGVSFLPDDCGIYRQAPYQEINKKEYEELLNRMPKNINWERLSEYEMSDCTKGSQELACSGTSCEVVDLVSESEE